MSTASPLPLEPYPPVATPVTDGNALRLQVAERLQQHRRRRGTGTQTALPGLELGSDPFAATAKPNRIAHTVAARFARTTSYREYLQDEAEAATRQAEAAAEVARRNAEAVAAAQQQLLHEIDQWNQQGENTAEPRSAAQAEPPVLPNTPSFRPEQTAPSFAKRRNLQFAREADITSGGQLHSQTAAPTPEPQAAPELEPPAPSLLALLAAEPQEPATPLPTNLIEFPRQLVAARKARPRLAEGPLREEADAAPERAQLRIFEVEATAFSTVPEPEPATGLPEWTSIHLDSWASTHEIAQPDAQVSLALPVYAAPLERRIMAALVDGCCVCAALLAAVAVAAGAGDALPTGLPAAAALALTLAVFTLGYLVLCFSLAGQTPGMRYARIALCTFGDDNPTRAAMRRRLFAIGLSAVSLGLGFAWALLDDDQLGWHDRISRMYQRAY